MAMVHHEDDPGAETRTRRRLFAVIRILQMTSFVSAIACFALVFGLPQSRGRIGVEMFWIAHSSPALFLALGIGSVACGCLLQLVATPLKRRWARNLRGWIE